MGTERIPADTGMGLTEGLKKFVINRAKELKSFYCREDFEEALKNASDPDRLKRLCAARGIDREALLRDPEGVLRSIPDRTAMRDELMELVFKAYRMVPSPDKAMERIVRNLAPELLAPEPGNDDVQVAILKKFLLGCGRKCKTIDMAYVLRWAEARMDQGEREAYRNASGERRLALAAAKLDNDIFGNIPEKLSWLEELSLMVRFLKKSLPEKEIVDKSGEKIDPAPFTPAEEAQSALRRFCRENSLPSEGSVLSLMEEIVSAGEDGRLHQEDAGMFFPALQEAFFSYCDGLDYRNRNGKISGARSLYEENESKAAAKKRQEVEVLLACRDLAKGLFVPNGKTRVRLYWFALVFDMTVALEGEERDDRTDLEKNLFEDYYCDNMLRYLAAEYDEKNGSSRLEKEPAGDGINFKNYVEALYLYYLLRKELPLTPGQRIDAVTKHVESIKNMQKKKQAPVPAPLTEEVQDTEMFRDRFEELLGLGEDALDRYILKYYFVPENSSQSGQEKIMAASETLTAYDTMEELMWVQDEETEETGSAVPFDDGLYRALRIKYEGDEQFLKVIDRLHERLTADLSWYSPRRTMYLAYLLHLLCQEPRPLRMTELCAQSNEYGISASREEVEAGMKRLSELGFDIRCAEQSASGGQSRDGGGGELYVFGKQPDSDQRRKILARLANSFRPGGKGEREAADMIRTLCLDETGRDMDEEESGLLAALLRAVSGRQTKTAYQLETALHDRQISAEGAGIGRGIRALQELGFDIHVIHTPPAGMNRYCLDRRNGYPDERMDDVLGLVSRAYMDQGSSAAARASEEIGALLEGKKPLKKRVSRSVFLSGITADYLTCVEDEPGGTDDYVKIYDSFTGEYANEKLAAARFQKINEKNILDIYVLASLYDYLVYRNRNADMGPGAER